MTDPVTLASAGVAAALSVAIGYLSWPRSPDLDGERFFKVVLANLLRGRVEAADGSVDDWVAAVLESVPYHPAGRFPERKVKGVGLASLPAAIEGEKALLEKLGQLPDVESRWKWMYREDEAGLGARLDDPVELGPEYDPAGCLGTAATWDAIADWGAGEGSAFVDALHRQGLTWVLVDGRREAPVLDALQDMVPAWRRVEWADLDTDALEEVCAQVMEDRAARLVLVGAEAGIQTILRLLVARAPLRDRVRAVVSVGGVVEGDPDEEGPLGALALTDWMQAHFTHHELDTEMTRKTPYFCAQWLDVTADPPGADGLPIQRARFTSPPSEPMTQDYVDVVDLGVLYTGTDPELLARGLWATVGCWTARGTG